MTLPAPVYLERLAQGCEAVREVLASGPDLGSAVPGCPDWTLRDLVLHLGAVHRWARTALTSPTPPAASGHQVDDGSLASWFAEGAADLQAALAGTDPDTPCWTFGPEPRTVAFWYRRQAHETAVHAVDARRAAGLDGALESLLPGAFALDGIDEVATVFLPRQVRFGRIPPLPATLAVVPDEGGTWLLGEGPEPEATLRGRAADLLLVLWKRSDPFGPPGVSSVRVEGDDAAARAVLGAAIVP